MNRSPADVRTLHGNALKYSQHSKEYVIEGRDSVVGTIPTFFTEGCTVVAFEGTVRHI